MRRRMGFPFTLYQYPVSDFRSEVFLFFSRREEVIVLG